MEAGKVTSHTVYFNPDSYSDVKEYQSIIEKKTRTRPNIVEAVNKLVMLGLQSYKANLQEA